MRPRPILAAPLSAVLLVLVAAGIGLAQGPGTAPAGEKAPQGLAPAAAQVVSSWEYDQWKSAVAFSPAADQYLVVWEDHHWAWGAYASVYGRFVNAGGTPLGGIFALSNGAYSPEKPRLVPDVAYNSGAGRYLAAWEFAYSSTDHDIYGSTVANDGTVGGESGIVTDGDDDSNPAVAANPGQSQHLVVFERHVDGEFGHHNIYAVLVDGIYGIPGSAFAIDTSAVQQAQCRRGLRPVLQYLPGGLGGVQLGDHSV